MDGAVQPSSVDLRVDRYFRTCSATTRRRSSTRSSPRRISTELVEVGSDGSFSILHPGEFVLGSTLEAASLSPTTSSRATRGKVEPRAARAADPLDRGLRGCRVGRSSHTRALQRREPADCDLPGDEDRPNFRFYEDDDAGGTPVPEAVKPGRNTRVSAGPHRVATTSISAIAENPAGLPGIERQSPHGLRLRGAPATRQRFSGVASPPI